MAVAAPIPFFEGCEKKIEILFDISDADQQGIRQVEREQWATALARAGITIEGAIHGTEYDCYMLSESSLIVRRDRLVCKTCGQSAPLAILDDALRCGRSLGCAARTVIFSRSNLLKPQLQRPVHRSFSAEKEFLDGALGKIATCQAYTFGDVGGTHWNLYVARLHLTTIPAITAHRPLSLGLPTLEVAMYDLHPSAAVRWNRGREATAAVAHEVTSISSVLLPGMQVDELTFDPCGYSMNAYGDGGTYACVHVTPQGGCSFASFEASVPSPAVAQEVVHALVQLFKPAKFSTAMLQPSGGGRNDHPPQPSAWSQRRRGGENALMHSDIGRYTAQADCVQQLKLGAPGTTDASFHFSSFEAHRDDSAQPTPDSRRSWRHKDYSTLQLQVAAMSRL
jgi:S-adenosylmethionine decarboxylase